MRQSRVGYKRNEPVNEGETKKEWEREARIRKRQRGKGRTRHIHWFSVPSCRRFQRIYRAGRFVHGDEPSWQLSLEGTRTTLLFFRKRQSSSPRPHRLPSSLFNWSSLREFCHFNDVRCLIYSFIVKGGRFIESTRCIEIVSNRVYRFFLSSHFDPMRKRDIVKSR